MKTIVLSPSFFSITHLGIYKYVNFRNKFFSYLLVLLVKTFVAKPIILSYVAHSKQLAVMIGTRSEPEFHGTRGTLLWFESSLDIVGTLSSKELYII